MGTPAKPNRVQWTEKELAFLSKSLGEGKQFDEIAETLGRTMHATRMKAAKHGLRQILPNPINTKGFSIEKPPSASRDLASIMQGQAEAYKLKRAHHEGKRDGVEIEIEGTGPYAILWFGDPHIDDDGTDMEYFSYCLSLVQNTDRLFAANIGDLSNNWVGRLQALYGVQHTTVDEERALVEWLVGAVDWLFVVLGNHDKWGILAEMVCRNKGVAHVSHGARFNVSCGDSKLVVDARHTHKGNSQYNPAFAQTKEQYKGNPAHIIIGGHTHTGAYSLLKNGSSGRLGHCIRLGAFKRYDDYADMLGFSDDSVGPACMTVIDPSLSEDEPGFCSVFWNLEHGVRFLETLRAG